MILAPAALKILLDILEGRIVHLERLAANRHHANRPDFAKRPVSPTVNEGRKQNIRWIRGWIKQIETLRNGDDIKGRSIYYDVLGILCCIAEGQMPSPARVLDYARYACLNDPVEE